MLFQIKISMLMHIEMSIASCYPTTDSQAFAPYQQLGCHFSHMAAMPGTQCALKLPKRSVVHEDITHSGTGFNMETSGNLHGVLQPVIGKIMGIARESSSIGKKNQFMNTPTATIMRVQRHPALLKV